MWAILDAMRDAVVSLALAWIGVFVEPAPQAPQSGDAPASCPTAKAGGACLDQSPGFTTKACGEGL
jgi:hypothetical protein